MLSVTIRVISKKRSCDFVFLCPLASDTSAIDTSYQAYRLQFIVIRKHYGLEGIQRLTEFLRKCPYTLSRSVFLIKYSRQHSPVISRWPFLGIIILI